MRERRRESGNNTQEGGHGHGDWPGRPAASRWRPGTLACRPTWGRSGGGERVMVVELVGNVGGGGIEEMVERGIEGDGSGDRF